MTKKNELNEALKNVHINELHDLYISYTFVSEV